MLLASLSEMKCAMLWRVGVLLLMNLNAHSFIQDILGKYSGQLVLIDFWASYCMPCLAEFPSEEKLMQKYPNMAFIYFSTDFNNERWQMSVRK